MCGFPFPSNVYLVDDPKTPTGHRIAFGPTTMPATAAGKPMNPKVFERQDGFSQGAFAATYLPGATATGLPGPWSIEKSLEPSSPTVVIDADTGERVAHFSEIDLAVSLDKTRVLLVRPVSRLKDNHRYIVAIRDVVDADGKPVELSPAWLALRDGKPSSDQGVEKRRFLYADIFDRLEKAGVAKDNLQIAWDFSTASRECNTSWMLKMRDDGLAVVGAQGPEYTIDSVEEDVNEHIGRRIKGKFKVPLYLDKAGPGGRIVFGDDRLPKQNGTGEYPFLMHIPKSITSGAKPPGWVMQYGHGLLGDRSEINKLDQLIDDLGGVVFALDLAGMAEEDLEVVQTAVLTDITDFQIAIDRQHQGLVNWVFAMRAVKNRLASDPAVQVNGMPAYDPARAYYRGDSQGGIFGGTYMAITPDIERGVMGVPGMPYSILLNRATPFVEFFSGLKLTYKTGPNLQLVLATIQMLWDRTEPNGYLPYLIENRFPNTPSHQVLLQVAVNDQQVSNLGAHFMARTLGIPTIDPPVRQIFGITPRATPFMGSAMVEFDIGAPAVPDTNTPLLGQQDKDPHGRAPATPQAIEQSLKFLFEGVVDNTCGGVCSVPPP